MTTRRRIRGAAAVLATAAAVSACSAPGSGTADGAAAGESVVIGVSTEPDTLSPLLGYGKDGNSKLFDGLLARKADMTLEPALATALPRVTDGGRTYTYTLREGVKFSDGKPLTARDVVFTYRTILDDDTNNTARSELAAVKDVRAVGDDTVVFTLHHPYAPFAARTVLPIVPEHVAGEQDPNTGAFNTKPVGTGPYVLVDWRKGEKLTFKANPHYWGGTPKVKKLTMAIVSDDDVRATRLRSGDLDGAVLPPNLAATFDSDDDKKTYRATSYDVRVVTLPSGNPVTGDTAIRRALDLAVDRQAMVDKILDGAGRPPTAPCPSTTRGSPRTPSARATSPRPAASSTPPAGRRAGTASAPRTAAPPASRCTTPPATRSARTTPSPTPPTPRRPASTSGWRAPPGRSSSPACTGTPSSRASAAPATPTSGSGRCSTPPSPATASTTWRTTTTRPSTAPWRPAAAPRTPRPARPPTTHFSAPS